MFQDYSWRSQYYPWRIPESPYPRQPLTTLLDGPIVGGPWEEGDRHPRSVREEWWPLVCPPEDTEVIDSDVAKGPIREANGQEVLEHWVNVLNSVPKRCVEIIPSASGGDMFPQTFDLWYV